MKAKLQIELVQEDNGDITVNVWDPLHENNVNCGGPTDALDIMDKMDYRSSMATLLGSMLSALSWMGEVKKIVDMRTGKVRDVSDRDYRKAFTGEKWDEDHIQEEYDSKVERGIIDPKDYPYEEFEKNFRSVNKKNFN